jgi:catechol 2,3-dioxygenase-like lactoylglutathione lyase family enzyme
MIPGLRGIEHVGITVPDIDAAVRFFVDILGCEECFRAGPFSAADDWMARQLGVDARAVIPQIRMIRCHNGANVEIFAYDAPGQSRTLPRNSDLGGHHIAFYVDAIEPAVAYLRGHDLVIMGDPVTMTEGPSAGETWVYFLSPWGLQMELVSYPQRMAFEAQSGRALWTPLRNSNVTQPLRS